MSQYETNDQSVLSQSQLLYQTHTKDDSIAYDEIPRLHNKERPSSQYGRLHQVVSAYYSIGGNSDKQKQSRNINRSSLSKITAKEILPTQLLIKQIYNTNSSEQHKNTSYQRPRSSIGISNKQQRLHQTISVVSQDKFNTITDTSNVIPQSESPKIKITNSKGINIQNKLIQSKENNSLANNRKLIITASIESEYLNRLSLSPYKANQLQNFEQQLQQKTKNQKKQQKQDTIGKPNWKQMMQQMVMKVSEQVVSKQLEDSMIEEMTVPSNNFPSSSSKKENSRLTINGNSGCSVIKLQDLKNKLIQEIKQLRITKDSLKEECENIKYEVINNQHSNSLLLKSINNLRDSIKSSGENSQQEQIQQQLMLVNRDLVQQINELQELAKNITTSEYLSNQCNNVSMVTAVTNTFESPMKEETNTIDMLNTENETLRIKVQKLNKRLEKQRGLYEQKIMRLEQKFKASKNKKSKYQQALRMEEFKTQDKEIIVRSQQEHIKYLESQIMSLNDTSIQQ